MSAYSESRQSATLRRLRTAPRVFSFDSHCSFLMTLPAVTPVEILTSQFTKRARELILRSMLVQRELRQNLRRDPSQLRFEPCLPRLAKEPPAGPGWLHEIKHDGFRIIARRDGAAVRLLTRNGYDFSERYPLIVAAVEALPAVSCVVDGEAIACDERGLSGSEMIRWRRHDNGVTICAFDLLELDG